MPIEWPKRAFVYHHEDGSWSFEPDGGINPLKTEVVLFPADQAPKPAGFVEELPKGLTMWHRREIYLTSLNYPPGTPLYAAPPDFAAKLEQERSHNGAMQMFMLSALQQRDDTQESAIGLIVEQARYHKAELEQVKAALAAAQERCAKALSALEWIERETHSEDGRTYESIHARATSAIVDIRGSANG